MSAMWCTWAALWLAGCALWGGPGGCAAAPPRTLEWAPPALAWHSLLLSPELRGPPSPPRRKESVFEVPLNCPEGQRPDGSGCVKVVRVSKVELERILLEHLNSLNASSPADQVDHDYGDGALQLTTLN